MEGQVLLIHRRQGSWFVRKTTLDAVTVSDRSFAVDGILEDRAWQVYEEPDPITLWSLAQLCAILNGLCELVVVCKQFVRSGCVAHDRECPGRIQHVPHLLQLGTANPRSRFPISLFFSRQCRNARGKHSVVDTLISTHTI